MKKAVLLLIGLLLINGVYAISVELKESYLQRETVNVVIAGNILEPIMKENAIFKRGHIAVPFEYDVKKLGDKYYLWFITPTNENNYTLFLNDISTTILGVMKKIDYEKNFSVIGNVSEYTIKPGFILTDKDFELDVELNRDEDKTITTNFPEEREILLKPGENKAAFSVKNVNETSLINVTIGDYYLPAYVLVNKTIRPVINLTEGNYTNITIYSEERGRNITIQKRELYCYEYPGTICAADEHCTGEILMTLDGLCCVGLNAKCSKIKEEEGGYAWIGYLIAAIVIIAGLYIWFKYYKAKKTGEPLAKRVAEIEKKKF